MPVIPISEPRCWLTVLHKVLPWQYVKEGEAPIIQNKKFGPEIVHIQETQC
jgi:hypothetical protein